MGTSRNDRSPDIPTWKPALAVIGRTDIPATRQLIELWRAAYGERGERLLYDFSQPSLAAACQLVAEKVPVHRALIHFDEINQQENRAGLAIELGRRALARCAASGASSLDFVGELFGEATAYYASRDLPSFVAAEKRVASNSEGIALKQTLQDTAKETVEQLGDPPLEPVAWGDHVARVLSALRGGQR